MDGSGGPRRQRPGEERHAPILRRLRSRGHDPRSFTKRRALPWFLFGGVLLALLALGPFLFPVANPWVERVATVLALFFFLSAVGFWFRMGYRALGIAAFLVVLLYAATAWTSLLEVRDIFVLTVLVGFFLFTLAGFNLLFVLEEVLYDAHRLLHLRHPLWAVLPTVIVGALLAALPVLEELTGQGFGTLRTLTPVLAAVLILGWGLRLAIPQVGVGFTREVHLLVAGALAGAGLADAVSLLRGTTGLLPSVIGYLAILGTWMYISFTSLQRAQYFLRARDVKPWVALLLSASFAVLAHTHAQFDVGGERALVDLLDLRVAYLVLGIWLGLAFFVLRGLWRVLLFIRDQREVGRRTRVVAGRLARVTEGLLETEHRVEDATFRVYSVLERFIPGRHRRGRPPGRRGMDRHEGAAVPLDETDDSEE